MTVHFLQYEFQVSLVKKHVFILAFLSTLIFYFSRMAFVKMNGPETINFFNADFFVSLAFYVLAVFCVYLAYRQVAERKAISISFKKVNHYAVKKSFFVSCRDAVGRLLVWTNNSYHHSGGTVRLSNAGTAVSA
jgi:hypothetical protein